MPVIAVNSMEAIGATNCQRKKIYITERMSPFLSITERICDVMGKKAKRIFDPSRGGTGERLNTASKMFVRVIRTEIAINDGASVC